MRALVMGEEQRRQLGVLRSHAESNPMSLARVMELIGHPERAPGSDPKFHCLLPIGFRVAFTIEQHPKGWYRHASVSVDGNRGAAPNMFAIAWIAKQLGFKDTKKYDSMWIENEKDPHPAVNVLELMSAEDAPK